MTEMNPETLPPATEDIVIGAPAKIPPYCNDLDESGNPAGGYVRLPGMSIDWQKGPVKDNGVNGAQIEEVVEACVQRLRWFQESKFACDENADAVRHFQQGLEVLRSRTARRVRDGVEGTHGLGAHEAALQKDLAAGKPAA